MKYSAILFADSVDTIYYFVGGNEKENSGKIWYKYRNKLFRKGVMRSSGSPHCEKREICKDNI
jgi:hypothetical protein